MNRIINHPIFKKIQKGIENLPGEKAHKEMLPYRVLTSLAIKDKTIEPKLSSVMCLLFEENEKINTILIERQKDGGKHSGQIAFPGGKKDETDLDLSYTALRETHEEIGVLPEKIEILGTLSQVYIPVSNFLVQPFVGIIHEKPNFVLSEKEVKEVFTFSLDDLLNEAIKKNVDIKTDEGFKLKNMPSFQINEKTVWGATSLILNELRWMIG